VTALALKVNCEFLGAAGAVVYVEDARMSLLRLTALSCSELHAGYLRRVSAADMFPVGIPRRASAASRIFVRLSISCSPRKSLSLFAAFPRDSTNLVGGYTGRSTQDRGKGGVNEGEREKIAVGRRSLIADPQVEVDTPVRAVLNVCHLWPHLQVLKLQGPPP
jgi:hypothetical protein